MFLFLEYSKWSMQSQVTVRSSHLGPSNLHKCENSLHIISTTYYNYIAQHKLWDANEVFLMDDLYFRLCDPLLL